MRPKRFGKYAVPAYIGRALELLRPPEKLTVSEWAEKYRVLDEKNPPAPADGMAA